jgi:membrane protein YdbS with pleckstrin-like domain
VKPDVDGVDSRVPDEADAPGSAAGGGGAASDPSGGPPPPAAAVVDPRIDADGRPIADGVERRLDRRVIQLDRIVGWIVTAVVSFGMFIAAVSTLIASSALPGWANAAIAGGWVGATALLGWWLQVWPAISYRHASYVVDASGIEIRRGVVWHTVTNVPRSRVQHTDVSQGPLERRFGIGTLVIHTAGTDEAVVSLNGVTHGTALAIRDHLLPREEPDAV